MWQVRRRSAGADELLHDTLTAWDACSASGRRALMGHGFVVGAE
jgi:hypothetical protein